MGDLSKNFDRREFACKCGCGFDTVDAELVKVVQGVRDHFERRVVVTSGCRCATYNDEVVKGHPDSMHKRGIAADLVVDGVSAHFVYDYLDNTYPDRYGIGAYAIFTHIDIRARRARWAGNPN